MKIIDTHAHLDFSQFDVDRDEVIASAQKKGVEKIITIGCSAERAKEAVRIAEEHENVFVAVGIHPDEPFEDFKTIEELATHKKVVAIGECGLDFFRKENPSRQNQEEAFRKHIDLAKRVNKPVIIHFREAREEALEFLAKNHNFPFVIHCFTEDLDFAKKIIAWGGMISFTGILTFPNTAQIQKVAREIPLEKIMLETDCPFLAPQKHRGKRCEPTYVNEVADMLAEIRGLSLREVAKQTSQNAEEFFKI